MPRLRLIAGPNGSGKTTLTRTLVREKLSLGQYLNPDDIAKHVDLAASLLATQKTLDLKLPLPDLEDYFCNVFSSLMAQAIAQGLRGDWVLQNLSLTYESVMSHSSHIEFVEQAVNAGFEPYLYYICTANPQLNVLRVKSRTDAGGHDVPEGKVYSRYQKSLQNVYDMTKKCKRAYFFDNSGKQQLHFAEVTPDGFLDIYEKPFEAAQPYWFVENLLNKWDKKMIRRATL